MKRRIGLAALLAIALSRIGSAETALSEREVLEIRDRLVKLYRSNGSREEVEQLRTRLNPSAGPLSEAEQNGLIASRADAYAEYIAMHPGKEAEAAIAKARSLGFKDSELGIGSFVALSVEEQAQLVETLAAAVDPISALQVAHSLSMVSLNEESRGKLLMAVHVARGELRRALLLALSGTSTSDVIARYREWASSSAVDVALRSYSESMVLETDRLRNQVERVAARIVDRKQERGIRLQAVEAAGGMADDDLKLSAAIGSVIVDRMEDERIRVEAISSLRVKGRLLDSNKEVLMQVAMDGNDSASVRRSAIDTLRHFRVLQPYDPRLIELLLNDPSVDLRRDLLAYFRATLGSASDERVRAAVERAEVALGQEEAVTGGRPSKSER